MATSAFYRFQCLSEDVAKGVHQFHAAGHTLKGYLSNATPNVATHTVKGDVAEITAEHGYTAGGVDTQNDVSRTGALTSIVGTDFTVTASGGTVGPFRYVVLYNATVAGVNLCGYWDYGSAITLGDTEQFTTDFGASMFTINLP